MTRWPSWFSTRLGIISAMFRAKTEALARLLDAGKLLFARLESKSWQGDFLKVAAHIYLRDF
jgi:hypothetical protein